MVDGDVGRLASVRVLLGVFLSACALGGCTSEAAKQEAANQALLTQAHTSVAALLREPASATFSNVTIGDEDVCGEVNGRNAFGGYGDKTRFVYNPVVRQAKLQPDENEFPLLRPEASRQSYCVFDQEYRQCKGETFERGAFITCSAWLLER